MRESVPATEERQDPLVPHGQSVTTRFQCPHCTLLLDPATVDNLALQAYQASDLLHLLAGHLATAVAPCLHDAVPAMLVHRRLDAAAVEKELFELISRHAVGAAARTSGSLDSRRKQEVYLEARRPVIALQRELERESSRRWTSATTGSGRALSPPSGGPAAAAATSCAKIYGRRSRTRRRASLRR